MLITDNYRELNRQLHETNESYGMSGQRYADLVMALAAGMKTKKILDYGAGKCTLSKACPMFSFTNYDPCVPGLEELPEPHDLVVCTDVLEHIEPDCLQDVLKHLSEVTKKILFVQVATRPASKTLADGRNTHLIVKKPIWWVNVMSGFGGVDLGLEILNMNVTEGGFVATFRKVI